MPSDTKKKCAQCGYTKAWHGRVDGAPDHEFEMPSDKDIVVEARELNGWAILAMPPSPHWPEKATFEGAKRVDGLLRALADEVERLRAAIRKTLDENGHLADGEDCTLIDLKRAVVESMPHVGQRVALLADCYRSFRSWHGGSLRSGGHNAFNGRSCDAESDNPSFQARWVSCGCDCVFPTAAPVEQSEPPALDCLVHGHEWKQEGTKHFRTHCGTGVDVGPAVSPARAAAEEWLTTSATHYEDDQDAINALAAIIERHYEGAR